MDGSESQRQSLDVTLNLPEINSGGPARNKFIQAGLFQGLI
jgi:polyisoprenoid-binding protein YceI